jgi:hypothetical protein
LVALAACDPGGDTPITPEDPIGVTLNIVFGSTTGGSPITFAYADPDGAGPQPAMISAPPLRANSVFNTNITVGIIQNGALSDRNGTVRDQDNQYQLFFLVVPPGLLPPHSTRPTTI